MFSSSAKAKAGVVSELEARDLREMSLLALRRLAHTSGAVERFTALMGGPPEFEHADREGLIEFIRENAP